MLSLWMDRLAVIWQESVFGFRFSGSRTPPAGTAWRIGSASRSQGQCRLDRAAGRNGLTLIRSAAASGTPVKSQQEVRGRPSKIHLVMEARKPVSAVLLRDEARLTG